MEQKIPVSRLYTYENKLKMAKSEREASMILDSYLKALNISTFSFTYYFYYPNSLNKLKYSYASKRYNIWHNHYVEQHYEEVDTTLEKVIQSLLPEYWETKRQLLEAKNPREREMREDSIRFGAVKGLCIPLHGPQGDIANFVIVQMNNETCLDNWQESQYELFLVGYYYFHYLSKALLKNQGTNLRHDLNKREMQCLTLLAQNLPIYLIAKKLHLTERTINHYIQRINKKLGTQNKHQSVARAISLGLVKT